MHGVRRSWQSGEGTAFPSGFLRQSSRRCPENEACYLALVWEPRLEEAYARTLRGRLLSYLEKEGRQKELKSLLKGLEKDQLDPAGSLAAAGMLVMQGFYEKAYGWLAGEDLSRLGFGDFIAPRDRAFGAGTVCRAAADDGAAQAALGGKYDGRILQELTDWYKGRLRRA